MKLKELVEYIGGSVVCCEECLDREVECAFASDLMSDVLTVKSDKLLLITGLANIQAVRTAEMSDLQAIVFVRNKRVSEDMIRLAQENCIVLIEYPGTMFRVSGLLYSLGVKPVY
ncbi:MAG: hypothetical protein F9K37_02715 [Bacteroidales bacterium]|nr:MAG: hypothetical protein F9K37_02715 [Bacteroidales bacterium]